MKKYLLLFLMLIGCFACSLNAEQVWVDGYYRSDGTYVQGHYRSAPDKHKWNNRVSNTNRDLDNDGILNEDDWDDNNNGICDDYE